MTEYRFEFKYLLDSAIASQADGFVRHAGLRPDSLAIGGDGVTPVTSLYFDNFQEGDYYDKSGGFLKKVKVRARTYAAILDKNSPQVWLELKKRHDAVVQKIRCPLTPDEWKLFLNQGAAALWRCIEEDKRAEIAPMVWELLEKQRKPKTLVRYIRKAYLGSFRGSRVRVTFDSHIEVSRPPRWGKLDSGAHPTGWGHWIAVEPQRVVMEIKSVGSLPLWFGDLIRQLGLERTSISKYAKSVETVKWYETTPR